MIFIVAKAKFYKIVLVKKNALYLLSRAAWTSTALQYTPGPWRAGAGWWLLYQVS